MIFKFDIVSEDNLTYLVEAVADKGKRKIISIKNNYDSIIIPDSDILKRAIEKMNLIASNV